VFFEVRPLLGSTIDGYYCLINSTCSGSVPAAGLKFTCSTTEEAIDLFEKVSHNSTVFNIDYD